ncbi:MAG TPA: hypothetical protein VGO43_11065 [Pyrinomonadaceae bacterium]|jgi:hypothetical protein|nr:hypothetical protein [Pyrinomonadaceae bacterium]
MIYSPDMTLGEARKLYFERSGFGADGGYDEFWIKVKVWRLPIWLPNTAGRVKAVKLHDLHHVLTEYPTTWAGEAEISAWEVGSGGLHHYWAGWWLDLMNVAQGLVVNPRGVYCGFMRGRSTRNLFDTEFNDEMLASLVGEYRHKLRLEQREIRPGASDIASFVFWSVVSALIYVVSVALPIAVVLLAIGYFTFWR